jgi:hypothetical protein
MEELRHALPPVVLSGATGRRQSAAKIGAA